MAGDSKKLQPIIVKKIKKGGHGHHGGAWKIAYADFVTAMMAFFLLMWLLGSTTKGDLKGIADYFQTPLKVALFGGSGSGDSSSVIKGGGEDLTRTYGQVKKGETEAERKTINLQRLKEDFERQEKQRLEGLKSELEALIEASGFRISCAMPTDSSPSALSFSSRRSSSSMDLSLVRSWKMTMLSTSPPWPEDTVKPRYISSPVLFLYFSSTLPPDWAALFPFSSMPGNISLTSL